MFRKTTFFLAGILMASAALADPPAAAPADPAGSSCEAKAVDKNGKPLAGAAKTSFVKKCNNDAKANDCAAKAIDKNGKPLAGAAKNSFVKKCTASP